MVYTCWHEFRPIPPLLPDRSGPTRPSGCPRHQADIALRVLNPPTLCDSHPQVPFFVLATVLRDDTQESHNEAHRFLHFLAAARQPYYFCQTCGKRLTET